MKTVLLLFGGQSSEHEISVASAKNVAKSISSDEYSTVYGYIDKDGQWWSVAEVGTLPDEATSRIIVDTDSDTLHIDGDVFTPDVVFPCLHGKNGEDGVIQALLEKLELPYVGCGVRASELCIDKVAAKEIAAAYDVAVVPYVAYVKGDELPAYDELAEELSSTLFVKPSRAGSSVGTHKASNQEELDAAIADALLHDDLVLIESSLTPRELEVAVLGAGVDAKVSSVGEILPDGDFYTYESKYDPASTSAAVIPADIDATLADTIQKQALAVYAALGCEGLSRVDFFVDKESGELYFNEINTMPGFTDISMYPKLWEHDGISNEALVSALLEAAQDRNRLAL